MFSVVPGSYNPTYFLEDCGPGDIGTLYFPDNRFLTETILHSGQWVVPGQTGWSADRLLVSNVWLRFTFDGAFALTITNSVLITSGGRLELSGGVATQQLHYLYPSTRPNIGMTSAPVFSIGGDLTLSNAGSLHVYGAAANPALPNCGAVVTVQGDVCVVSNSWIHPYSHPTNGGSPLFRMRNLTILTTNAGFNADAKGYMCFHGPGSPTLAGRAGGSYGGVGYGGLVAPWVVAGTTYGSSNAPVDPGSGGRYDSWASPSAPGAGAIRIEASDTVTVNGLLTAGGLNGGSANSGGGSGGGVFITCRTFAGTNGTIKACGGSGDWMGSGAGGRIAIWRMHDVSAGAVAMSAAGGTVTTGGQGEPGTIVWGRMPLAGTLFRVH